MATDSSVQPEELNRRAWYAKGATYWKKVDATLDGVLGGFAHVSPIDISESKTFLRVIKCPDGHAIDCGAGIGRVTSGLLIPYFKAVDLVEQDARYVAKARELITDSKLRHTFCSGLQDFKFAATEYDCIWIQWVVGHLPEDDFVAFLQRCKLGIAVGGFIVLKDNCVAEGFVYDLLDESVTRCDTLFRDIFERAGLRVCATRMQKKFPRELFPVRMYALQASE